VTADQRAALAREYLDGARKRKVTQLPPSLLVRECAELRRHLGQLLDVIGEQAGALQEARAALLSAYEAAAVMLTAAEVATVLDGLAIAAECRRYRASLICQACAEHPAGLCEDHQADLDQADEYDVLARQIGGTR